MTRAEEYRQLFAYNRWACERVLEAVAALSDEQLHRDLGSSFPSIRATLVHVMSAEWVWLSRLQGSSPAGMPEAWERHGLEALRREWAALDRRLQGFVAGLTDAALDAPLSYRNTAGQPFTSTLSEMLRHVVNHSSYHRGQITTMLRQLGASAPATDLILYHRTAAAAAAARPEER